MVVEVECKSINGSDEQPAENLKNPQQDAAVSSSSKESLHTTKPNENKKTIEDNTARTESEHSEDEVVIEPSATDFQRQQLAAFKSW